MDYYIEKRKEIWEKVSTLILIFRIGIITMLLNNALSNIIIPQILNKIKNETQKYIFSGYIQYNYEYVNNKEFYDYIIMLITFSLAVLSFICSLKAEKQQYLFKEFTTMFRRKIEDVI